MSLAIWDHTVLPSTRHKWTHPAFTPANQAGTRFTYPGGMEGWVDHEMKHPNCPYAGLRNTTQFDPKCHKIETCYRAGAEFCRTIVIRPDLDNRFLERCKVLKVSTWAAFVMGIYQRKLSLSFALELRVLPVLILLCPVSQTGACDVCKTQFISRQWL